MRCIKHLFWLGVVKRNDYDYEVLARHLHIIQESYTSITFISPLRPELKICSEFPNAPGIS